MTLWKATADEVGDLLGAIAASAVSVSAADGDRVLVHFDQTASRDQCQAPANKQRLEALFSDRVGRKMQVEFEAVAPKSAAEGGAAPRRSRRQMQTEAAQQPFVKTAMELFDVPPEKLRYTPPPEE